MYVAYAGKLIFLRLPLILIAALLGVALMSAVLLTEQNYQSTSYLALQPTPDQTGVRAVQPDRFIRTAGQRLLNEAVLNRAASSLGDGLTSDRLRGTVTLTGGAADDVLQLHVVGASAIESAARMGAMLTSISQQPQTQVTSTLLWTTPPKAALSRNELLAGGFGGGALLGVLLVLGWGAYRRPLLSPEHAQTEDVRVESVPGPAKGREIDEVRTGAAQLLALLRARNRVDVTHRVLLFDLAATDATRRLAEVLEQSAPPGLDVCALNSAAGMIPGGAERRTVVFLGVTGITNEVQVRRARRSVNGAGDDFLLVLTTPQWK